MLSLNLIVRAIIIHDRKLLVNCFDDGHREPFHMLLGGHLEMGESITECITREIREETSLTTAPSKLLYIVENLFMRGAEKLHELGFYFLCHIVDDTPSLLGSISPDHKEFISPELVEFDDIPHLNFQPPQLAQALSLDCKSGFVGCPKLIVVNEIPGDSTIKPGTFPL